MAKMQGMSKSAYQKTHLSLKNEKIPLNSQRNSISTQAKGKPENNISLQILDTPSKLSARSLGKFGFSEQSATPKKKITPMTQMNALKPTKTKKKEE